MHDNLSPGQTSGQQLHDGKARKGLISWRWLIVVAVLFWNLGFDIRGRMDRKLINVLQETVNGCGEIMEELHLNHPHKEKKPMEWVSVDTQNARA